jgi:hypothetical protein
VTERDLSRWPVWLGVGNTILLLTIIWGTAAWKTQIDEQMNQHRHQITVLSALRIHPEAERRIDLVQQEARMRDREIAAMKDDLVKRLERIENMLDRLSK